MRRALPGLVLLLVACTAGGVDLDVSTSLIDIPTTTIRQEPPRATTTLAPEATTTTDGGLSPIIPDTAQVVPIRPVLLSDDSGARSARVEPEQVADWVRAANEAFAPARIGFSYDPNQALPVVADTLVNEIGVPGSSGRVQRVIRANAIAETYPGELVVLFTGVDPGEEIGSHHLDFVLMGEASSEPMCGDVDRLLLAHRIGLYLGLPHTFAATHDSVTDAADTLSDLLQQRSAFDGDSFEDTLPDPGVYLEMQCEERELVTIGGLEFELPRTNLMSHYVERTELTLSQVERVRWMLGVRRANDMAVPVNEINGASIEAESILSATSGPCGLGAVEPMTEFVGYRWGEGDHLVFPSSEGCRLEFTIPVPDPGSYELVALGSRGPSLGAVEFLVDGERFLLEDLYAPLVVATGPLSLGVTTLEGGSVVIGVEVVGINSLSADTAVALDGFALLQAPSG